MSVEPGEQAPSSRRKRPVRRTRGLLRETIIILVSALVISLVVKTFLAQAFYIPSASMENTLVEGDRVLVSKLTPRFVALDRGDIVVFKDPGGWLLPVEQGPVSPVSAALARTLEFVGLLPQDAGEHLIKRVVGLPGDRVTCCDAEGRLSVNGIAIDEPYLKPGSEPSEVAFDIAVTDRHLWVMGDHRQNSQDSRAHLGDPGGGLVPVDSVVGTAFVVLWPPGRIVVLHGPDETFAEVAEALR